MEYFENFTPIQLTTVRNAARDMLIDLGGYYSVERLQIIADTLQFSWDEVHWLLSNTSSPKESEK